MTKAISPGITKTLRPIDNPSCFLLTNFFGINDSYQIAGAYDWTDSDDNSYDYGFIATPGSPGQTYSISGTVKNGKASLGGVTMTLGETSSATG
jgi:hypothetical protein